MAGACVVLFMLGGCGGGGGDTVVIPLQSPANASGANGAPGGTSGAAGAPGTGNGTNGTNNGASADTSGAPAVPPASGSGGTTGGASTPPASSGGSGTPAGTGSADGSSGTAGSASGGATPPAAAPVVISAVSAPADGTTLSGNVFLRIEGTNIQNAELLPADSYTPRLGEFVVAADRKSASLLFNTTTIPNGPLHVRISAFNLPPGSAGASEVVAMPARTWHFANQPSPY
ncbi:MAG: hypothetical protein ACM3WS_09110, partial [Bacillota bacterium]